MRVVVTGAEGFLGWHARVRLHALRPDWTVVGVGRSNWASLTTHLEGADAVIHLAGINRATDAEVSQGNVALAEELVAATRTAGIDPVVAYANSTQAGNGTPYGLGKQAAADVMRAAYGERFTDVVLPNLFGEHGRPGYNSFVATFAHDAVAGKRPAQLADRPIRLLHAQAAAQVLLDAIESPGGRVEPAGVETTVAQVWNTFERYATTYLTTGDIPSFTGAGGDDLMDASFGRDLFNTLRAAAWPGSSPISLVPRADDRGRLVETVRCHGAGGQTFVSTTKPGVTRGEHFHLRKIERFAVVAGEAEIALRRTLTDEVVAFQVSGDEPVAIDMPTMWTHNITATGSGVVTTLFWTNELFDPDHPDTYWEKVRG